MTKVTFVSIFQGIIEDKFVLIQLSFYAPGKDRSICLVRLIIIE